MKKTWTISQSRKFHKLILKKKNYKFAHCVNLSINLFHDAVKGMCTVQIHTGEKTKKQKNSQQISYIILRNQVHCFLKIALVSRFAINSSGISDYGSNRGKQTFHTRKGTVVI